MRYKFLFLFLFITSPYGELIAQSQNQVLGIVIDQETKEPIPFANVFFKSSPNAGMVTDYNGKFSLSIKDHVSKDLTLVCTFVGYLPIEKQIKNKNYKNLKITLKPETTELSEVVFEAPENPAYAIIRKAAKQKSQNGLETLGSTVFESYNRSEVLLKNVKNAHLTKLLDKAEKVVENIGTKQLKQKDGEFMVPLFVTESLSKNYQNKSKKKEQVISKKISGLGLDPDDNLSQILSGNSFRDFDFTRNNINILDKSFPSPISDLWRLYYEMWLIDSVKIDKDICYKIEVEPKIKGEIAFKGTIWITKDTYDLKKLSLSLPKEANLNFVESILLEQKRTKDNGVWHVSETKNIIDISEIDLMPGLLLKFIIKNDPLQLNPIFPEEIFEETFADQDTEEIKTDEKRWNEFRTSSLDSNFVNLHAVVDSVQAEPSIKRASEIGKILINGYVPSKYVDFGHYLFLYANNNIEGNRIQLGFRTTPEFSKKWFIKPWLAYGFKDQEFKYNLKTQYIFNRKKANFLTLNITKDLIGLAQLDINRTKEIRYIALGRWGNLAKRNPYYIDSYSLDYSIRANKNLTSSFGIGYRSINKAQINKSIGDLTTSISKHNLKTYELTAGIRFAKNERIILTKDNRTKNLGPQLSPIFNLVGKLGRYSENNGKNHLYGKVNLSMRQKYAPMFGFGSAKYFVNVGAVLNKVPYELLKKHQGNNSIFAFGTSIQMMNDFEFISDYYLEAKYEHFFEGRLINRIPVLKYLNQITEARIVASGGFVYGGLTKKNLEFNKHRFEELKKEGIGYNYISEIPYVEAGIGLENLFHFFRVDFYKRFTYLDTDYDIQKYGVKVSATFKF